MRKNEVGRSTTVDVDDESATGRYVDPLRYQM
jgi:hypothetical protein